MISFKKDSLIIELIDWQFSYVDWLFDWQFGLIDWSIDKFDLLIDWLVQDDEGEDEGSGDPALEDGALDGDARYQTD